MLVRCHIHGCAWSTGRLESYLPPFNKTERESDQLWLSPTFYGHNGANPLIEKPLEDVGSWGL